MPWLTKNHRLNAQSSSQKAFGVTLDHRCNLSPPWFTKAWAENMPVAPRLLKDRQKVGERLRAVEGRDLANMTFLIISNPILIWFLMFYCFRLMLGSIKQSTKVIPLPKRTSFMKNHEKPRIARKQKRSPPAIKVETAWILHTLDVAGMDGWHDGDSHDCVKSVSWT